MFDLFIVMGGNKGSDLIAEDNFDSRRGVFHIAGFVVGDCW